MQNDFNTHNGRRHAALPRSPQTSAQQPSGFPGPLAEPSPLPPPSLNLSEDEVRQAAGGYRQASFQLEELHRRGFVRAYRSACNGSVVLERGHYEAVTRGLFGVVAAGAGEAAERKRPTPDRAAFMARFGKNKGA